MQRLRRIEGQVRGVIQMVERDRYCLDKVQQINAVTAAMREVALLIISAHLTAGVDLATHSESAEPAITEMMTLLRAALKQ